MAVRKQSGCWCKSFATFHGKCPVCGTDYSIPPPPPITVFAAQQPIDNTARRMEWAGRMTADTASASRRAKAIALVREMHARNDINSEVALIIGMSDSVAKRSYLARITEIDANAAARKYITEQEKADRAAIRSTMVGLMGFDPLHGDGPAKAPEKTPVAVGATVQPRVMNTLAILPPSGVPYGTGRVDFDAGRTIPTPTNPALLALPPKGGTPLKGGDWRGLWEMVQSKALTESEAAKIGSEWKSRGL